MIRLRTTLSLLLATTLLASTTALGPDIASAAVVTATQPTRVLDTRNGTGVVPGMVGPGSEVRVLIPAAASAGASTVVLNLTATGATSAGWVKAWPCNDPMPATSVVNFDAGRTAANAVILKYDSAGLCLVTSTPVHLLADLTGWFVGQSDFTGSTPSRILDMRSNNERLVPNQERRLAVAGQPGLSAAASIAALNLTVVDPSSAGWLVAYPCEQPSSGSTVNFSAREAVANLTVVGLTQGSVCFRSSSALTLIVDSYGFSTGAGALKVQSPNRLLDSRNTSQWPAGAAVAGSILTLRVAGRAGVPNDADSVWVTVTVVDPTSDGYVTAWPCDQPMPTTSTANTWPGALRSNLAPVKLAATDGTVCLRYGSAQNGSRVQLVVDAVGWTTGGPTRSAATGIGNVTAAPPAPSAPSSPTGSLPSAGNVLWSEDFSSAAGMDRFVKRISVGDNVSNGNPMQSFNGDHDHSCGSPATTRPMVEDYQISTHFWYCAPGSDPAKGHMMTGLNTVGYVIMAFAPKADNGTSARVFPATTNQVCWDQNLTDLGTRKFTQLVVINADRYQANGNGINYVNPDFNTNGGAEAIHTTDDDFIFVNLRNSVQYFNGQNRTFADYFTDRYQGSTDKATRYTICVRDNNNGTVTRYQSRPGGAVSTITGPGRFPTGPRVFIIEDDSYNPMKSYTDEGIPQYVTDPFTWHWDNIRISAN